MGSSSEDLPVGAVTVRQRVGESTLMTLSQGRDPTGIEAIGFIQLRSHMAPFAKVRVHISK